MRELGNKSRMQKRYRKPKTLVTVDQNPNLLTPEQVNPPKFYYTLTFTDYFNGASCWHLKQQIKIYKSLLKVFTKVTCFSLFSPQSFKATMMGIKVSPISVS